MKSKIPVFFLSFSLSFLLIFGACGSLKTIPQGESYRDPFSRTYPVPFKEFHPRLNQTLQKVAREKPGSSFQIARLGNDSLVLRGSYQAEANQLRWPVNIVAKPAGPQKTHLEIRITPGRPGDSPEAIEAAAGELFQIIRRETGFTPGD
jgi:hypothetical protein